MNHFKGNAVPSDYSLVFYVIRKGLTSHIFPRTGEDFAQLANPTACAFGAQ